MALNLWNGMTNFSWISNRLRVFIFSLILLNICCKGFKGGNSFSGSFSFVPACFVSGRVLYRVMFSLKRAPTILHRAQTAAALDASSKASRSHSEKNFRLTLSSVIKKKSKKQSDGKSIFKSRAVHPDIRSHPWNKKNENKGRKQREPIVLLVSLLQMLLTAHLTDGLSWLHGRMNFGGLKDKSWRSFRMLKDTNFEWFCSAQFTGFNLESCLFRWSFESFPQPTLIGRFFCPVRIVPRCVQQNTKRNPWLSEIKYWLRLRQQHSKAN